MEMGLKTACIHIPAYIRLPSSGFDKAALFVSMFFQVLLTLQGLLPIKLDFYMPNFDDCMRDKAQCTENKWYLALPVHILHTFLRDMS